jgi:capsular polysaccharide biosynthesis protein
VRCPVELRRYLQVIRRRWWVALTAFVISTVATLALVLPQPPVYQSTGTLVIGPRYFNREETVRALETLSNGEAITATYASIAGSDLIRRRAVARLEPSVSVSDLTIGAEVLVGTNILSITVRGDKPQPVRALAEAVAAESVAYVGELDGAYELKPLDPPDLTSDPVGANKSLTIGLGMVFGAMLGVGLALLFDSLWGTSVAAWSRREEAPIELPDNGKIIEPEEYLRKFWHELRLAEDNGEWFSFGVLHVGLRDPQHDDVSYELDGSHLTRIADMLQSRLGHEGALAYLGHGTFAVMLPDTPVSEAETLLSDLKSDIASIAEPTEGEATARLEVTTGLLTSLTTAPPQPKQLSLAPEEDGLSSNATPSHLSLAQAETASTSR